MGGSLPSWAAHFLPQQMAISVVVVFVNVGQGCRHAKGPMKDDQEVKNVCWVRMLLLKAGDVERNPGPQMQLNVQKTRGRAGAEGKV